MPDAGTTGAGYGEYFRAMFTGDKQRFIAQSVLLRRNCANSIAT